MNFDNLELPRDRCTINAWCRSFYALNPDIHRIINQHALLLSNYYQLVDCDHEASNQFCRDNLQELHVEEFIQQMMTEYFVLGEVFVYAELNESAGNWRRVFLQNPDYIVAKRTVIAEETKFFLRPDENLRRIVFSDKPKDIEICKQLTPTIVDYIKNGENVPMDNFYLFSMINRMSPYEIRGTSFLVPLLPILVEGDRQRRLTDTDLQTIKETLFDVCILNTAVRKDIVMQRYNVILNGLEYWLNNKLLAPIAKLNSFTQQTSDKKELCFPKVRFDRIKLRKDLNKIK